MRISNLFVLFAGLTLLTACHSIPKSDPPNSIVSVNRARAWVDQDGTFYPPTWKTDFPKPTFSHGYSLQAVARNNGRTNELRQSQENTRVQLQRFIASRERLFILVHGYNNNETEARQGFEAIEQLIRFRDTDGVIEFYWDGLSAFGLGSLKIWFNATGYSQLAGTKALREILNRAVGKEIIVISHSRGASVVMSALSDPPYRTNFATATFKGQGIKVFDNPALKQNGNNISAILLAPAIGCIDLGRSDFYQLQKAEFQKAAPNTTNACGHFHSFRSFDSQLKNVYFTVNKKDPALAKWHLSRVFNPTDLGCRRRTADEVAKQYPNFHDAVFDMKSHAFIKYVKQPAFRNMLASNRVDTAHVSLK